MNTAKHNPVVIQPTKKNKDYIGVCEETKSLWKNIKQNEQIRQRNYVEKQGLILCWYLTCPIVEKRKVMSMKEFLTTIKFVAY